MTVDDLADLLKSRGVGAVWYFHTDHFEPWSSNIDDVTVTAVEKMAEMARSSPYARKLSLFYSVFIPYRLESEETGAVEGWRTPGDRVVFGARSARQEEQARNVIRPLVTDDSHELHMHVHHEFWTRNSSDFANPVSRWVNAHSTREADERRLDLYFGLCNEVIGREIGRPFDRWAFIHGNWALNASDPLICHVDNEMAMMMRHGGFGDFSFPAGRGYCDPMLEAPFTCLPLEIPRAFDDPSADPRPITAGSGVLEPDRFFIWNSPIKSGYSSLDYYSASNRELFQTPDRIVEQWLAKSVSLDDRLFLKTHAHSMKWEYKIAEPGALIPHCYPAVMKIFDCLARVCDRAGVELRPVTVNEVMDWLRAFDRGGTVAEPAREAAPKSPPMAGPGATAGAAAAAVGAAPIAAGDKPVAAALPQRSPPQAPRRPEAGPPGGGTGSNEPARRGGPSLRLDPTVVSGELLRMHRDWIAGAGAKFAADDLYQSKVTRNAPLEAYETAIARAIAARFPAEDTLIIEIGTGWGGFAVLLARHGFAVRGFEGNNARYAAAAWHCRQQIERDPALVDRLAVIEGFFPEVFSPSVLVPRPNKLCVATNITSSYTADNQEAVFEACAAFDELIIDLARFGQARNSAEERKALLAALTGSCFEPVERLYVQEPYEYWHFRTRPAASRRLPIFGAHVQQPVAADIVPPPTVVVPPADPPPGEPAAAAPAPAAALSEPTGPVFPLRGQAGLLFSAYGNTRLGECPVCHGKDTVALWRMPMANLKEPISLFGGYFNQVPTLQVPGTVFCFDFCHGCESIFLNPVLATQKQQYRTTDHYVRKMQGETEWRGYENAYDSFARWIPPDATVMMDAACGIGQYLHVARKRGTHAWRRLIGLELSEKYVEHMRGEGFEAYAFDIDNDDLHAHVEPDSVDFITFCEAFEHVERPLDGLGKLLAVLRPGGRLYLTAQRYGKDVQAAVRPGEPIYIGERVVQEMPQRLGCRIVDLTTSSMRYYIVLEK